MRTIEEIRSVFINPENPQSCDDLAKLSADTVSFFSKVFEEEGSTSYAEESSTKELRNTPLNRILCEILDKESETRFFNGKSMGQIHPHGSKIGILSKLIAGLVNTNTIVREVSPVESKMEFEVCERIAKWFKYSPKTFSGNITSGGSTANIEAMWVARERLLQMKPEVKKMHVLVNDMAHYSIDKAVDILGSQVHLTRVPMNGFKTDVVALEETIQKILRTKNEAVMAIIAIAGETETGEIDDLEEIALIAETYNIFFHVDAAYGGPFILSKRKKLFNGIEKANSITIDPHKMMYLPYSAGLVLFRNYKEHALIEKGMRSRARYLIRENSDRELGMSRIEGSMGPEGAIGTWATLQLLGEDGLGSLLNSLLDLTNNAYEILKSSEVLKPLHSPKLNTLLIGLRANVRQNDYNETIEAMSEEVQRKGFYISINHKVDDGRAALRLVIMHPHTTGCHIEALLGLLEDHVINLSAAVRTFPKNNHWNRQLGIAGQT